MHSHSDIRAEKLLVFASSITRTPAIIALFSVLYVFDDDHISIAILCYLYQSAVEINATFTISLWHHQEQCVLYVSLVLTVTSLLFYSLHYLLSEMQFQLKTNCTLDVAHYFPWKENAQYVNNFVYTNRVKD